MPRLMPPPEDSSESSISPDMRVEVHSQCQEYVFFAYSDDAKAWMALVKTLGRWGSSSTIIFPWYIGALLLAHARDCGMVVEFIPPQPPVSRLFVKY